jgi:CRISPR-associated protein Csc1
MSKAELKVEQLPNPKQSQGEFTVAFPLNPLDVMFSHRVLSFDVTNMPPVSLIRNARIQGQYYYFEEPKNLKLPAQMQYRFQGA